MLVLDTIGEYGDYYLEDIEIRAHWVLREASFDKVQ